MNTTVVDMDLITMILDLMGVDVNACELLLDRMMYTLAGICITMLLLSQRNDGRLLVGEHRPDEVRGLTAASILHS